MKKGLFTSALVLPLVAMGLGTGAPVLADTVDVEPAKGQAQVADQKTSKATVTVKPGKLQLISVPNLKFNSVTVKNLATQQNTKTSLSGRDAPKVELEDFRGDKQGWELRAQLGDLKLKDNTKLSNTKIHMHLDNQSGKDLNMPNMLKGGVVLDAGGYAESLLKTNKTNGFGAAKYLVDAEMNIGKQEKATAGDYSGTITWSLFATR
ncbi:WxL domain-containing protein [Lacticaseibacillus hegangensis]|uniref:WxL domain-containing protein n=1 Tax=Lacticaseibacillus hegangensis TaxID=2486010 RepID=A0ABW4CZI7_9LACO|nr:WxL domain-containing protein [Lacticaseibacillus hegangensis]